MIVCITEVCRGVSKQKLVSRHLWICCWIQLFKVELSIANSAVMHLKILITLTLLCVSLKEYIPFLVDLFQSLHLRTFRKSFLLNDSTSFWGPLFYRGTVYRVLLVSILRPRKCPQVLQMLLLFFLCLFLLPDFKFSKTLSICNQL